MTTQRKTTALCALTVVLTGSSWMLAQNPGNPSLTPPPGGPTNNVFKTLDQVEPRIAVNSTNTPPNPGRVVTFEIGAAGSYYLTANLEISSGIGIEITADHVSLDLNGFAVLGGDGLVGSAGSTGILISGRHVTVSNGSVCGWVNGGIIQHDSVFGGAARGVTAAANGGVGIRCDLVAGCTARGNGNSGIKAMKASGCLAIGNGLVANFSAEGDGTFWGIDASTVSGCTAESNDNGIRAESVTSSTSFNNEADGFRSGYASECTAARNGAYGFRVEPLVSNYARAMVVDCIASHNNRPGFGNYGSAGAGGGIYVADSALVRGNAVSDNGGTGIEIPGDDCTVISNHCKKNLVKTVDPFTGGVTTTDRNYVIASGNIVGSIHSATSAGISGSTGGGTGATDPGANFAH